MRRVHLKFLVCAVFAALFAAPGRSQATGYWQYFRTETYILPFTPGTTYPDTHSGVEGNFKVTISERSADPPSMLRCSFYWSRPPSVLIPDAPLYWPVSASVDQPVGGRLLNMTFTADMHPYQEVSNLLAASPWAGTVYAALAVDSSMPVGTLVQFNNALTGKPEKVPDGVRPYKDENGYMAIRTWIRSSSIYYWSYIYKWNPAPIGSCGDTCTLGSSGQGMGRAGGAGSVAITTTSTWDVKAIEPWIKITSPLSGTGTASVGFTVDSNAGSSRLGTILIGGRPYTIAQDGSSAPPAGAE